MPLRTLKCSFVGPLGQEIVYVINDAPRELTVIGDFGTHTAKLLNYEADSYYVLEPNRGASVATIIFVKAGETPAAIRSTLGKLSSDQYKGIPDEFKLPGDNLRFLTASMRGRCLVQ